MSIRKQSLLAAAAALRAVAETTEETQEHHQVEEEAHSQIQQKRARSVSPTQAYQAPSTALAATSGMAHSSWKNEDVQGPPPENIQTPPLPPNDEELSKRISTILRHKPGGCEFRVDGSARLDDVAALASILPTTLWGLVTSSPGPHRIPRWETAVVDGDLRIRATYKHSYEGFIKENLRAPMAAGAPPIDYHNAPTLRSRTQAQQDRKRRRNQEAHQRKKIRRESSR